MLNLPEYIVWLWFFPVLLQICLPLALLPVVAVMKIIRTGRRYEWAKTPTVYGEERRENVRLTSHLSTAVIAEYNGKIDGRVLNVSLRGICIADYPAHGPEAGNHIALYDGRDNEFNLLIQPRWQESKRSGVTFGAVILNKPFGWAEMLQSQVFSGRRDHEPLLPA